MNKSVVIILVLIALAVIGISFGVKNFAQKRSENLVDKTDEENRVSLLKLAERCRTDKDYLKTREVLKEYMKRFPDTEDAAKAKSDIEELNVKILFSDIIADESFPYEIKSGDSLAKIAAKFNTTTELLKKSNGLKSDLIFPGKTLKVNKAKYSILVNKSKNTLVLRNSAGETVKTYIVSTGENFCTPAGTFKIEEKLVSPVWYKVGAVVEPTSSAYELGSRWMGLSIAGYGIHGTRDPASLGKHITKGCVRMKNEDVEELYAIVPSGTEVTIVE